jgi:hypothetical protein
MVESQLTRDEVNMLIKKWKRLSCLLGLIAAVCISACVTSPELELGRNAKAAGNLEVAYSHYMQVLQTDPGNAEARGAVNDIRGMLTSRARQEAQAILKSAGTVTAPALRACIAKLDQYATYDPQGTYLGNDRNTYAQQLEALERAIKTRIGQAKMAINASDFSQASSLISTIKAADPQYPGLDAIEASYRKSYGAYLERQIMAAYADNRVDDANAAMKVWMGLGLPEADRQRLMSAAKTQEVRVLRRQFRQLVNAHQYYTAYLMLSKSKYKGEFIREFSELRQNGAPFYLDQARRRVNDKNVTRAYLESVKGLELNPKCPGMFEMHRDTRDKVLDMVQQYIAIPAFGSPQDNPDVGVQFTDALISYLFRILPYGINIVERGKIDMLMAEHKREFSEVANILNVDLIVTGNVSLLTIDRQDTKSQSTVRAPVGEKLEVNPEYEAYIQTNDPRHPTGASPPPKTIKVKQFGTFTINKGRATIKGFSSVAVRIFNTSKGRITYAQEFNANFKAADDYQDGLDLAGIESDPLDLPSDTEIKEKLRNQIVKQLSDVIQAQFAKRERTFLQNATYHISRRETKLAIDELAKGFLYCVKAKVGFNDPDFTEIRNKIVELTEVNFI